MTTGLVNNTQNIGLWIGKISHYGTSQYGSPPKAPASGFTAKFLVSFIGGTVLWQSNEGLNYYTTLLPGVPFPVYDFKLVLASGTDWQTTSRTTSVTDMEVWGE